MRARARFIVIAAALMSATAIAIPPVAAQFDFSRKTEQAAVELKPGYSVEAKVGMRKGTRVDYIWNVSGGSVFFDKHGEREEGERSYATGRGSTGASGVLEAAFDGSHGWMWRNTSRESVRITVRTTGEFNFLLTSPATNR
ncbi:hypothetical protein E0H22_15420 [Rhodopseudomonas boonkerdii]|uniref:hypothetical protein n=1 Tax=Rhodopseudomonas boonkerdii TaxID=475937 RepID=UPI001E3EF8E1|nr:hypothetical protein [Rhodopseudomonas boonkerdii]UGV26953.1 hypothetical protein E0H22_15420 [Rhodopseudomonas boonkerdii]